MLKHYGSSLFKKTRLPVFGETSVLILHVSPKQDIEDVEDIENVVNQVSIGSVLT